MVTWRHGALEARCRRVGVEEWSTGGVMKVWGIERRRCAAGVQTWRYGVLENALPLRGMELGRRAAGGGMELGGRAAGVEA